MFFEKFRDSGRVFFAESGVYMAEKITMTQQEFEKLQEELEAQKSRRKGIAEEIAIARGHGDLSENAEYDAALNEQAELEENISKLEERVHNAHIITEEELSEGKVNVGHVVKVKDLSTDEELFFEIVGQDPDPFADIPKITLNSSIGRNLNGKEEGEVAEIMLPDNRVLHYQIVEIRQK